VLFRSATSDDEQSNKASIKDEAKQTKIKPFFLVEILMLMRRDQKSFNGF